ncbi:MAG: alanine--glyoxylate aminotransferase family protein [Deltaproteobacteria bacterium]|nr:alanine--glyoxylate aminotransferase family protein [Deltaproteobacteria bacterium]MBW2307451.1 alanine--glyoxylate aminotransferase family protein [Deltaproteobacteria bacterium]
MSGRSFFQIPGPTNVPGRVLQAMGRPLINHRGPEFAGLLADVTSGLKYVYQTVAGEVVVFPGSGTGGLEAALVNAVPPGSRLVGVNQGAFSNRWADMALKLGYRVETIELEWGGPLLPEQVVEPLLHDGDREIRAVLITHNETSTGVTNDLEKICRAVRASGHPALILVDAVSSLGCMDLRFDEWGIDVAVTGAQKGLMCPPGLAIVAISPGAAEAARMNTYPRFFWDIPAAVERLKKGQCPCTPATSLLFGLREALVMIREEGLERILARHAMLAEGVRRGILGMGLSLLVNGAEASNSVTAVRVPGGVDVKAFMGTARDRYRIVLGGGLGKLEGKIFRIGHMGYLNETEVLAIISGIEMSMARCGAEIQPGTGVRACEEVFFKAAS